MSEPRTAKTILRLLWSAERCFILY